MVSRALFENPTKTKLYFLLCLQCVTISFNVAAIAAAVPSISLDLGLSDLVASKIIPFYMIPYGLGALLYALLVKRFPFRTIMGLAMGLYGLSSLLCAFAGSFGVILTARVLMGVTGAGVIPLGLILIGRIFPAEVRGRLVGVFFSCSFFSSIAGVAVSGLADWRWLFLLPAGLGLLAGALVSTFKTELLAPMTGRSIDYRRVIRMPKLRHVFIFIFLISMLFHAVTKWFGVYLAHEYGLTQFTISFFFILIAIGGAMGQIGGGVVTDLKGRYEACHLGILILAATTMALFFHYPLWALALILFVLSAGWTIGHNGVSTVLTDYPDDYRPEIASLNSSVRFLSGGLGFLLSGLFVKHSFAGTFLGCGVFLFILSFSVHRIIPRVH